AALSTSISFAIYRSTCKERKTFLEEKSRINSSTSSSNFSAISTSTEKEETFRDFKKEYSNIFDRKRNPARLPWNSAAFTAMLGKVGCTLLQARVSSCFCVHCRFIVGNEERNTIRSVK